MKKTLMLVLDQIEDAREHGRGLSAEGLTDARREEWDEMVGDYLTAAVINLRRVVRALDEEAE